MKNKHIIWYLVFTFACLLFFLFHNSEISQITSEDTPKLSTGIEDNPHPRFDVALDEYQNVEYILDLAVSF
jgi:hypothetical protein